MNENPILNRRRFVGTALTLVSTFGRQRAAGALGLAPETGACRLVPEQEVGPYYVSDELLRSNIVEGKPGVPLSLRLVVLHAEDCKPLPNVAVDLWHCDALGLYSGFTKQNPMGPGGPPPGFDPEHPRNHPGPPEGMMGPPPQNSPTDKLTFLRGIQLSDAEGVVVFQTVFPGFYMGRTNHIHFKVRVGGEKAGRSYGAGHTSHVGQIFFPEDLSIKLMQYKPYTEHNIHRTTQAEDQVYNDQEGELSVARLVALNTDDLSAGLHADLIAAVDPIATPAPAGRRPGPDRRPGSGPPN
ncbi:MAG: intradiol ring-cleavage dioxygenase [Bryobacteraceae bacterium]